MGTSKSFPTPSGGSWTQIKNDVSGAIGGNPGPAAHRLVSATISAAGGLAFPALSSSSGDGTGGTASGGGRTDVGGGRGRSAATIGRSVRGLASFGSAVHSAGLDAALTGLGLDQLRGKSAIEVIGMVADHLAGHTDGLQREIMVSALSDTILECAALEGDVSYQHLETSLQSYLDREGIEGLVEVFLTNYVYDRVWSLLESHASLRAPSNNDTEALSTAIRNACGAHVRVVIADYKQAGRFDRFDWFGSRGLTVGQEIVSRLETRIVSQA